MYSYSTNRVNLTVRTKLNRVQLNAQNNYQLVKLYLSLSIRYVRL